LRECKRAPRNFSFENLEEDNYQGVAMYFANYSCGWGLFMNFHLSVYSGFASSENAGYKFLLLELAMQRSAAIVSTKALKACLCKSSCSGSDDDDSVFRFVPPHDAVILLVDAIVVE
jgi:hypothetical protein